MTAAAQPAVVVRENDPFPVANVDWGVSLDALAREADELGHRFAKELGRAGLPIDLDRRTRTLRASGVAGFIGLGRRAVQIVPKFVTGKAAVTDWPASVQPMLRRARRLAFSFCRVPHAGRERLVFLDHVAVAYGHSLERALSDDAIRVYRSYERSGYYLRGTLDVARQLGSGVSHPHVLHYVRDELSADNPFNHLLAWVGAQLVPRVFSAGVRRRLEGALALLPELDGAPRLPAHLPLRPPPQFAQFQEPLELAALVAQGLGGSQSGGHRTSVGYVLDMAKVFEGFVEASLRARLRQPFIPRAQVSNRYAIALNGDRNYYTRPDNVVYQYGTPVLLVDAKYKRLADAEEQRTKKPSNADVYQMAASLLAHQCERGLLVYPRLEGDALLSDGQLRAWQVEGSTKVVLAIALPIGNLGAAGAMESFDAALERAVIDAAAFAA
jgi:5-methylcytosine-specific restriction enzyme subunit McrC